MFKTDKISGVLGVVDVVAGRMAIELGKTDNRIYPNLSVAILSYYNKRREKLNGLLTNIKKKYNKKIKIDKLEKPKQIREKIAIPIKNNERLFLKKIKNINTKKINELNERANKNG